MARWKLCASTIFEILPHSTCTRRSKNPISPKIFNRFSNSLHQLEDVERRHLGGKFQVCACFIFAMARWKLCASTNIWNFATFDMWNCASKNLISSKVFNRLWKSLPQLDDGNGGHLCGKFQVRIYFTFAMARWKLCATKTFEILPLSSCTLCQQKSYIPKVFNRFSKSLPQLEDVEGWHLGGKFQVRRYFNFAMARWKLCASTTFEILLLSTCTLCQQKSNISKDIQPIFELFASARRCWASAFGWKISGVHVFYICKGKVKTLRSDSIWNFATLNLYTVPAKILYLQRYSAGFPNLCLSSKTLREGHLNGKFHGRRYFTFAIGRWNLCASKTFEILPLSTCTQCQKNPASPKAFNRFSKSFRQLEDVEGGHLGEKFQVRRYFTFAMARWKLCASTTFEILLLSTCTLCQQKSYVSKGIHPIFEIFPSARRCWGWAFGWKVSGAQVFYFCNGKLKTWRIDNISNFTTINLYTVPAKILYLQRYSADFRNLCLISKMLTVAICVKSFRCGRILFL